MQSVSSEVLNLLAHATSRLLEVKIQEQLEYNGLFFMNDQILMHWVMKITTYIILNDWSTYYTQLVHYKFERIV